MGSDQNFRAGVDCKHRVYDSGLFSALRFFAVLCNDSRDGTKEDEEDVQKLSVNSNNTPISLSAIGA